MTGTQFTVERITRQLLNEHVAHHRDAEDDACCALVGIDKPLITHLVELVLESYDTPVQTLEPMIREIVIERVFVDESGDCIVGPHFDEHLDREVHDLIGLLEKARRLVIQPDQSANNDVSKGPV